MSNEIMDNEQLQSKVIKFLRFPLIVGVVLIHTQLTTINGVEGDTQLPQSFHGAFPIYETVSYLVAHLLARIAVPLFFVFSGFLFFYKTQEFTAKIYRQKLVKRMRTLFVPFLFWNILFVCFFNVKQRFIPDSSAPVIGEGYATVRDWLLVFWNYRESGYPVSLQFWFIRDLMVVVLFTPFIYWLTQKMHYSFSLLLGFLWFMGWWFDVVGFGIDALFFFSLGAYFSIANKSFVGRIKTCTLPLGLLFLALIVMSYCTSNYGWNIYMYRACVLLGVVFAIAWVAAKIERRKWTENTFLSESSFFVFAYHLIAIPIVKRILFSVIPCTTDLLAVALYFLWAALVVVLGLLLYWLSKKCFPKITAIVTGGR